MEWGRQMVRGGFLSVPGIVLILSAPGFPVIHESTLGAQDLTSDCTIQLKGMVDLGAVYDPASVREPVFVDIARLPGGDWVVAEDGSEVIRYSEEGAFEGFFGRKGDGPGELRSPTRVAVDPFDSLWVSDNRRRIVVYSPEGTPSRTITRTGLLRVTGFTPSGLPFSMLTRDSGRPRGEPLLFEFIQVWNRAGEPLLRSGPGEFETAASGRIVLPLASLGPVAVDDSTFLSPGDRGTWVYRWTPSRQEEFLSWDAVRIKLDLGEDLSDPDDRRPIAIAPADNGGYWVIGAIRRLSREDEDALANQGPRSPLRRFSPQVRNEVFDGILVHVTDDGVPTTGLIVSEYLWGFADPAHPFSFREQ